MHAYRTLSKKEKRKAMPFLCITEELSVWMDVFLRVHWEKENSVVLSISHSVWQEVNSTEAVPEHSTARLFLKCKCL